MSEPITYEWLQEWGFRTLPALERQPFDTVIRCIGLETVDDHFMTASEDLCIHMSPGQAACEWWYCWIAKSHAFNRNPHVWIHVRHLRTQGELILLYEGLTGRKFGKPSWNRRELAEPIFTVDGV